MHVPARFRRIRTLCALFVLGLVPSGACAHREAVPTSGVASAAVSGRASLLPDVSGLAWIEGDRFLAVHDAKLPDEAGFPRVSLLDLPSGLDGVRWRPLGIRFGVIASSDLESVARVPDQAGRALVLIAESTEEVAEKPFSNRILLLEVAGDDAAVVESVEWPAATANVEGMAVGEAGGALVFLYAERAHGRPSSEIRYAEMTIEPLRFGTFHSAGAFVSPGPTGAAARPVSALEVDAAGVVYAASAEDPDDDGGPFRSAVYRIGRLASGPEGAAVELDAAPELQGWLDGFKVESLAARPLPDGAVELWVGVDDEHYGGTIRRLPSRGPTAP